MKHHPARKSVVKKSVSKKKKAFITPSYPPLLAVVSWIILCELAGIIGSVFTISAIPTWYETLVKPVFNPPNWIFGPVWTTLYALMGVSAYRIWRMGMKHKNVRDAIVLFLMHLVLNAIWSPIFFGARQIPLAFVTIAIMWLTLITLMFRFEKLDKVSAVLLAPYLAWVSFAMVLNYNLWILNP